MMQVLRIGDLVAHKHYPEEAIGKISKFYDSGRVGVDDGCRPRSFLPGSLLLWHGAPEPVAPISPGEVEELGDAIAHSEVMEVAPAQKACPECGSTHISPDDMIHGYIQPYMCDRCDHQWEEELTEEFEELAEIEELENAIAKNEACPECNSYDVSNENFFNHYFCGNCHHVWETEVEELGDAIAHSEVMERPPTEPLSIFQKFEIAASLSEVMELRLKPENLPDRYENCPQCGSNDLRHATFHDPDEYYFCCKNCGREGWSVPTTSPTPPAQVEEVGDAIANSEVMELPRIPKDFSKLEKWPEWREIPLLLPFDPVDFFPCDDDCEDDDNYLEPDDYLKFLYRGWVLEIYDSEIFAMPPNSAQPYHCECELNLDGPDGQIAIAQEFIDSWYFAQVSPGQLSLNIVEAVARDPPPQLRLTA